MTTQRRPYLTYVRREKLSRYYSIAKVRRLYRDLYNYEVVDITGYKHKGRLKRYNLFDCNTGKNIYENVTLEFLGYVLEKQGDYDN